jgi:membrane protein
MLARLRAPAGLRRLGAVLVDAVNGYFADGCSQFAAAIAYRVLFSIAPLAIVLTSVAGVVLRNDTRRGEVVDAIVDALPIDAAGRQDVENAIVAIARPASLVGLITIAVFAWTATGMMSAFRAGLAAAMRSPGDRPLVRGKLVDLILVMTAGLLVLLVVIGGAVGAAAWAGAADLLEPIGLDRGWLQEIVTRGVPLAIATAVVMLLYRFVPARRLGTSDALAGALVTSLLLLVLSLASARVYRSTLELSAIYGSLTTLFVFLYTVYLHACALLLGAEVAAGWARWPERPLPPPDLRSLAGRAVAFVRRRPGREREQPAPPSSTREPPP